MADIRTLIAFNTATASDNKIHDDATAARFGFTGGLVPGVDVFAYLAHAPAAAWGRDWLHEGAMRAKFLKPVYDGDEASVRAEGAAPMALTIEARGLMCATGEAVQRHDGRAPARLGAAPLPPRAARPPAAPESLPVGAVLGSLQELYMTEVGHAHLLAMREDPALFDHGRIANPAYLLRRANYILALNVVLGPWIHIESDVRLHCLVEDGDPFETRAVVADNYEAKGHLTVALDFTISVRERLAMSGRHWAIYAPRQVREAGGRGPH